MRFKNVITSLRVKKGQLKYRLKYREILASFRFRRSGDHLQHSAAAVPALAGFIVRCGFLRP